VSAGLWPLPEKGPLNAHVFGRIERGDYSVEKAGLHRGFRRSDPDVAADGGRRPHQGLRPRVSAEKLSDAKLAAWLAGAR
jgi:hypothetical protein